MSGTVSTGNNTLAKKWLVDLTDFIIIQSILRHRLLPLGTKIENICNFLLSAPFLRIESHILLLLLEFSTVLNFSVPYDLIKPHLGKELSIITKIMPMVENEHEVYEKDILNCEVIRISAIKPTWEEFKKWFLEFVSKHRRTFSPIQYNRPLLLCLVSSVFRDRYFPEVWRDASYYSERKDDAYCDLNNG